MDLMDEMYQNVMGRAKRNIQVLIIDIGKSESYDNEIRVWEVLSLVGSKTS